MIRQAISYLRGATSSAVLIGIAVIAAGVIIVAASTGSNPISALGLGPDPDPVLVRGGDDGEEAAQARARRRAAAARARRGDGGPAAAASRRAAQIGRAHV